ncbi:MAG: adenylate/guanylate cyclase domain-containing protein [Rhodospirillales bacterium]|nr:adenylate/guanylate cyclase domain-containing protein [Rhodospirillales bacterium]
MRRRDILAACAVAVAVGGVLALPALDRLEGLSIDALFWLRHKAVGRLNDPARSPTVVVAIDEETYRTPPFADIPNAMWTPELAEVLDAVLEGGAKVVGFDIVYPTSVENRDERLRGFDRKFLLTLRNAARSGKVVLGKVQHQEYPVAPSRGQSFAVGNEKNIRALNVINDDDEIIRRVPMTLDSENRGAGIRRDPSLALELAQRALDTEAARQPDGGLMLGGYRIPGSERNAMPLNFDGGNGDIPTYSLADLFHCAAAGKAEYFRRHFAGKVVLIGATLDVEDRRLTAKRFTTAAERPAAENDRCVRPPMAQLFRGDLVRDTIPGVYVHATAVNNLLRGDALIEVGRPLYAAISVGLIGAAAFITVALSPIMAAAALGAAGAAWMGLATAAFRHGMALPLFDPLIGAAVAFAILLGYRFAVADRDKRFLRRSFALYLAPAVIDKLIESDTPPALGGESRDVSVLFSDIAGFSKISESLSPAELVSLMNEYLSAMTDIVEQHGGFVDKYIGDAIVAVFGAPLDDPDHALNAVRAALACRARLIDLNQTVPAFQGRALAVRIGINTGEALVGNIGSRRRFNYTVMGDMVNLASRLEGVNKAYGTDITIADTTASRLGGRIACREIDTVRVVGRDRPVSIFEPLAEIGALDPARENAAAIYAAGLAAWRARDFSAAVAAFGGIADRDPAAAKFAARARMLAAAQPVPQPNRRVAIARFGLGQPDKPQRIAMIGIERQYAAHHGDKIRRQLVAIGVSGE